MTLAPFAPRLSRLVAAILALFIALPALAQQVEVTGGAVRGVQARGRVIFHGIPFAAPPLAERRWRSPAPAVSWSGVRDAIRPAPACLQNDYGWNHADHVFASEDCLTLDVVTPALAGKRPVIVWIHGGSNRAGSPGDMVTSSIVDRGIVLVGVRYRLGVFGFLSHRGAAAEADGAAGNYGLLDQVAALRWVQANIARFGGDPANVTIAGESAGAQDVGLLLASPLARGLFHKAAMQSGTPGFGLPFRSLDHGLRIGDQLDALIGVGGIAKLRGASANALLAADLKLHDAALTDDSYLWLRTTIDGTAIPDRPDRLLARAPPRAVLIGSNRFELDLPGGRAARDTFVAKAFGDREAAARAFYRLDEPDPPADPRLGIRDQIIATDVTFRCPAGRMADLLARSGSAVWRYEFDHAPGGGMTRHAIEIPYIFGEELAGGLHLQEYWANLAHRGDPNGDKLPHWPRYELSDKAHLLFDKQGATRHSVLRREICDLMERL